MGSVYKARDTRLDRFVALKLLRKELSADPVEAARLEQEARLTAAVNHPNVVQVYSAGMAHGQIYLVMELVDHGSLDDLMAQQARVPEAQVLAAGIQVARGLQAAHAKGLIHRDVKPANILFADAQTAKIGDFGLAIVAEQKAEAQNEIWGTPYYVAPERLNNEPEDFRSDIYSLGATLFHALAGKSPIEGETTSASELRQLKSNPPTLRSVAPEVSRETARVIDRMVAPSPADRFASYAELIGELEIAAQPRATSRGSRLPLIVGLSVLFSAAAIAVGLYFAREHETKREPAPSAIASVPPSAFVAPNDRNEQAREKDRLTAEAAEREAAEQKARDAEREKLLAEEIPRWQKSVTESRARVAVYDFDGALNVLNAVSLSEPSLVGTQTAERKKIGWLIEWKRQLIVDITSGRFRGPVQIGVAQYQGATKADNTRISFRLPPYGTTEIEWTKIPPKTLLAISSSLIQPNAPDAADRQWLSAVFAHATGQSEAAAALAASAAKAKPDYSAQLPLLATP